MSRRKMTARYEGRFLNSGASPQPLLRTIQFHSPPKNQSVHIGIHRVIGVRIEGRGRKLTLQIRIIDGNRYGGPFHYGKRSGLHIPEAEMLENFLMTPSSSIKWGSGPSMMRKGR